MILRSLATSALVFAWLTAHAWIETGHMVVAEIAERHLTPQARARAAELAKIGTDERTSTFVTCSVWADDFRTDKDRTWHYINIYFRKDGKPVKGKPLEENVVWAIRKFTKVLEDPKSSKEQQAEALRYLVHFVGDAHQPLHAVSFESDQLPDGDRGGNSFQIAPVSGWSERPLTNLHALWDFGCGEFTPTRRPLNEQGRTKIKRIADEIEKEFPRSKIAGLSRTDPMAWARESFEIAKDFAYDLTPGKEVSKEYLARGRKHSRERAAAAGYRLADLLNRLLK